MELRKQAPQEAEDSEEPIVLSLSILFHSKKISVLDSLLCAYL